MLMLSYVVAMSDQPYYMYISLECTYSSPLVSTCSVTGHFFNCLQGTHSIIEQTALSRFECSTLTLLLLFFEENILSVKSYVCVCKYIIILSPPVTFFFSQNTSYILIKLVIRIITFKMLISTLMLFGVKINKRNCLVFQGAVAAESLYDQSCYV